SAAGRGPTKQHGAAAALPAALVGGVRIGSQTPVEPLDSPPQTHQTVAPPPAAIQPSEAIAMEPQPRQPPALPEELVEEILPRFPPEDPARLVRAALVCRTWCRVVAGPGFRRRFRQFHRTPPMLGFLCNFGDENSDHFDREFARFVLTSSFRPPRAECHNWHVLDSRHGRVLLYSWKCEGLSDNAFAIWDPITDERVELPIVQEYLNCLIWSAAVLCAGDEKWDYLDCCHGPFRVVIVATRLEQFNAYVYSSEAGSWSQQTSQLPPPSDGLHLAVPNAVAENALYFAIGYGSDLLMYDLATQEISAINPHVSLDGQRFALLTMDTGWLGFAIEKDFKLYLWSREVGPEGDAGWTQSRVMDLKKLLLIAYVLGYANGIGVFFVLTHDGLFTIDLKSSQVKKVKKSGKVSGSPIIFPYMSFYSP
uniref:F-box domain-containing protein n=1 Tax=Setaria italica TaxID=4555 RepID=K3ZZ39_SETIT